MQKARLSSLSDALDYKCELEMIPRLREPRAPQPEIARRGNSPIHAPAGHHLVLLTGMMLGKLRCANTVFTALSGERRDFMQPILSPSSCQHNRATILKM